MTTSNSIVANHANHNSHIPRISNFRFCESKLAFNANHFHQVLPTAILESIVAENGKTTPDPDPILRTTNYAEGGPLIMTFNSSLQNWANTPWFVYMACFVAGLPFLYQMVDRSRQIHVPKAPQSKN